MRPCCGAFRFTRRVLLTAALGLGVGISVPTVTSAADPPVIAAAADLNYALAEVADLFTKETGRTVKLTFGSSGNFARQIAQGGPFEMYMSADESYVRQVAEQGKAVDDGTLYAVGRLVVFAPTGSAVKPDADLTDLAAAVVDGRIKRFAIANPDHAPYGRAAREALVAKGLWEKVQDKLVLGENVSQATQFATSGNAQAALIPYSLSLSEAVSKAGTYALLPETWHTSLRQRMVLLKGAGDTAKAFYTFVQGPKARAILEKYGFVLPANG